MKLHNTWIKKIQFQLIKKLKILKKLRKLKK